MERSDVAVPARLLNFLNFFFQFVKEETAFSTSQSLFNRGRVSHVATGLLSHGTQVFANILLFTSSYYMYGAQV